jgi:hypothetical protein
MGLIITGTIPLVGGATQENAYVRISSFSGQNEGDYAQTIVYVSWYTSLQARQENITNRLPIQGIFSSFTLPTIVAMGGTGQLAAVAGYETIKQHLALMLPDAQITDDN